MWTAFWSFLKNAMYTCLLNTCFNFLLPALGQCSSVCTRSSQLIFDASCFFLLEFKLMWRLQVSFCSFLQKLYKKRWRSKFAILPPSPLVDMCWKTQSRGGKHWMMRGGGYFTRPWEIKHNTIQPFHQPGKSSCCAITDQSKHLTLGGKRNFSPNWFKWNFHWTSPVKVNRAGKVIQTKSFSAALQLIFFS